MTVNLEADILEQVDGLDETKWTPLQAEVCMAVANARFYAFAEQAAWLSDCVRRGLTERSAAVDTLQLAARYNGLAFEYGEDQIQTIVADAFRSAAA